MALKFNVGDQVKMRKSHPCGSYIWQVTRVKFERMVKSIVTSAQS